MLVTAFAAGRALDADEVRAPGVLERIVKALRAIHDGPALPTSFPTFTLAGEYADRARAAGGTVDAEGERLARSLSARISAVLRGPEHEPVPCHNDLLPANFLRDGEALTIIDWEYAGMNDRYFDLGNLAVNNELGPEDELRLLEAYFGETPPPRRLAALRLMRLMSDVREALWGVVQAAVSDLDFDYDGYARSHFERLSRRRVDPRARGVARCRVPRELPDRARVVIVGGGVGGTSIAYHLAELGERDVAAARPRRADQRLDVPLRGARRPAARRRLADADDDVQRRALPAPARRVRTTTRAGRSAAASAWHARPEREQETRRQVGWAKTFGLPLELISPDEAQELFPLMVTDGVLGASYLPTDGYLDPSQLTYALADGARQRRREDLHRTRA